MNDESLEVWNQSRTEAEVMAAIAREPRTVDELVALTGRGEGHIRNVLTRLVQSQLAERVRPPTTWRALYEVKPVKVVRKGVEP